MISAAVTLVGMGMCLSIGFHYGKKITNQLDYLIYCGKEKIKRKESCNVQEEAEEGHQAA